MLSGFLHYTQGRRERQAKGRLRWRHKAIPIYRFDEFLFYFTSIWNEKQCDPLLRGVEHRLGFLVVIMLLFLFAP